MSLDSGWAALIGVLLGGVVTVVANWVSHRFEINRAKVDAKIERIERLHRQLTAQMDFVVDTGMRLVFAYVQGGKLANVKESAISEVDFLVNAYLPLQKDILARMWESQNKISEAVQVAVMDPTSLPCPDRLDGLNKIILGAKSEINQLKLESIKELHRLTGQ